MENITPLYKAEDIIKLIEEISASVSSTIDSLHLQEKAFQLLKDVSETPMNYSRAEEYAKLARRLDLYYKKLEATVQRLEELSATYRRYVDTENFKDEAYDKPYYDSRLKILHSYQPLLLFYASIFKSGSYYLELE